MIGLIRWPLLAATMQATGGLALWAAVTAAGWPWWAVAPLGWPCAALALAGVYGVLTLRGWQQERAS